MPDNGEGEESLKKISTAEQSRQSDILQAKDTTFLSVDGCLEKASEFSMSGYVLAEAPGGTPRKIGWGCAARFPKPLPYL